MILITFSLALTSCQSCNKDRNSDPSENWVLADFGGYSDNEKIFDVPYSQEIVEKSGLVSMFIMKSYTDYGQLFNSLSGIKSLEVTATLNIIIVNPKLNRFCVMSCRDLYEDGSIRSYEYEADEVEWITPDEGSVGAKYIALAKRLAD